MRPLDLIATANTLLAAGPGPLATNLRRAVSTFYYAVFHCLAGDCADLLIGRSSGSRSDPAWVQVYRSVEHKFAQGRCRNKQTLARFPPEIQYFAYTFANMQDKRHEADYDPTAKFTKSEVKVFGVMAERAIREFHSASPRDRRSFCAYILFKERTQ